MARKRVNDLLQNDSFWLVDIVPALAPPFFLFSDGTGFSGCTAPEIVLEEIEVVEGTSYFVRKVAGKARASSITLSRGVAFWDTDFIQWIEDTIQGGSKPRRTMALFHLHKVSEKVEPGASFMTPSDRAVGRVWILFGCLPTRYKAGSDFDASDASVSIQELDFSVERVEQINMAKGLQLLNRGIFQ